MIEFSFSITHKDLTKAFRALHRVANTAYARAKRLPWLMATDYAHALRKNIQSGVFSSMYPPYNERYREYKELMVGHLKPWVLFGDVLANISVWHHGKRSFKAGIPAGRMDRGMKGWFGTGKPSSIAAYAWANEFGSGRTPARPVFRPTLIVYKHMGAQSRVRQTMEEIGRHWHD